MLYSSAVAQALLIRRDSLLRHAMGLSDQSVSVALRLPPPVLQEEEPFCLHICGFCVN